MRTGQFILMGFMATLLWEQEYSMESHFHNQRHLCLFRMGFWQCDRKRLGSRFGIAYDLPHMEISFQMERWFATAILIWMDGSVNYQTTKIVVTCITQFPWAPNSRGPYMFSSVQWRCERNSNNTYIYFKESGRNVESYYVCSDWNESDIDPTIAT